METNYIGEHLFPGQLGHFSVILAFIASLVATISYFLATRNSGNPQVSQSWKRLARTAFLIQVGAVLTVFLSLFYIISHHYFEYYYAWEHSSRALSPKYLLACFWEGQEGSFLLWTVWHCVLGCILIGTSKSWENPVMTILSFAQFCLASMLLGIYVFGYKVGSNPFILLRNAGIMPFQPGANYLSMIHDGVGLNALLQNYWMVIHPPILFLGFASTIIPFAYAVAGLWTRRLTEWTRPALIWSLFAAMVLGTGVMMGAAWAYESLTFGGYWAWDPVENASLVPWLTLVAGIHTLLVYRHSGQSLRSTFFFLIITFILILYSTFLTRSGILGNTSVHAFTDLGMSGQLLVYLFIFMIPAFYLFFSRYKKIPTLTKEEPVHTREFWMFIGSLILFISAIFISFSTSIPVWNQLFHTNMAEPIDREFHYNRIQVFIAISLGLGTGAIQYYKYKTSSGRYLLRRIWLPFLIALVLSALILGIGYMDYRKYGYGFLAALDTMVFASIFGVVANFNYIFSVLKGKIRMAGASVAHVGFGLMLLGIVISSSKKQTISLDRMGMMDAFDFSDKKDNPRENTFLPAGIPVQMSHYEVTYEGDSTAPGDPKLYYLVRFMDTRDSLGGSFTLHPDVLKNTKGMQGFSPNPSSQHYWNRDIFTYVNYASNLAPAQEDTAHYYSHLVQPRDTIYLANGYMILEDIRRDPRSPKYPSLPGDIAVAADLKVYSGDRTFNLQPIYFLRNNFQGAVDDTLGSLGLYVRFNKIIPQQKKIDLLVKQRPPRDQYIVLKAYIFPYINVLWIGTLIMIIGFALSIVQKIREQVSFNRRKSQTA